MRPEQWQLFRAAAKRQPIERTPLALIIDSPWIPGYLGIGHLDYYLDDDVWFEANRRVMEEFPGTIFLPSWWLEYGMAIEPSAFGTRLHFFPDQTPQQTPILFDIADVKHLAPADPQRDGFMPFALHRYRKLVPRVQAAGYTIPMVAARGPLCTAAFLRGVNELLLDLVDHPAEAHALISLCADETIAWLKAQAEAIGPSVEGILVLDDIAGFMSRPMYLEFAHPYFQRICQAFPESWVKVYHNDARTRPFLKDLPDSGFEVLNFSHTLDIEAVDQATGGRMVLLGNVNPLELGVRGTPEQVREAATAVLGKKCAGGLILSFGGGVSPGTPGANLHAMEEAAVAAIHS